ncbi:MAG TPA: CehA/McbA family metallohydrolase, partial [Dehalococcoidia bacterium]|nr:CehA/McbA family metallohydrolase [Dehalococcoidia bacterium]
DVEVGSDADPNPAAPQEPNTGLIDLSADAGGGPGRWMGGDLHCHTLHSDGRNTVEQIVLSAIERGLEFLAVTDHNTVTHHAELERLSHLPIVLIPGEEVTTYYGHTNAWGLAGRWVDFRCVDGPGIRAIAEFVLSQGGLCSVNHPKGPGSNWRFETAAGYPCMEVWQAPWQHRNWESVARWEHEVAAGQRIVMVGGSDVHSIPPAPPLHPHGLGNPTTWVYVRGAPSPSSVLEGIRRGHAFISADPSGPRIELTAHADGDTQTGMAGDALHLEDDRPIRVRARVSGASGKYLCLIADGNDFSRLYLSRDDETQEMWLHPGGRRYVRAEVRDHGAGESATVWAMSNPIWFERG